MAGWSQPPLPPDKYGRGLSQGDAVRVQQTIAEHGAEPTDCVAVSRDGAAGTT